MLFVSLMTAKPGATAAARRARRLEWKYPEGMRVVAEYWLATEDPRVVLVSEADDPAVIFQAIGDWDDVFTIDVFPAVTAEEGIASARRAASIAKA